MSCYNSTTVNAPIDVVWKAIRNFQDLAWGEPVITSVKADGGVAGDNVGAKQVLNELFHETLLTIDDQNHMFSYSIDDGTEPISPSSVSDYAGTVRLLPIMDEDTTLVEWTSKFSSSQPDAVAEFCNPIYAALLSALKQTFARQNQ